MYHFIPKSLSYNWTLSFRSIFLSFLLAGVTPWAQAQAQIEIFPGAKLLATNGAAGDEFGASVATDGQWIIAGSPGAGHGVVRTFEVTGPATFTERAEIPYPDGPGLGLARFGFAVAVEGGTVLIGAPNHSEGVTITGATYVYEPDGNGGWTQVAKLLPSTLEANTLFGESVAIEDTGLGDGVIIVGAPRADGGGIDRGEVFVFENDTGPWLETQILSASNAANIDRFGSFVDLEADPFALTQILVGSLFSAYRFDRQTAGGLGFTQRNNFIPNLATPVESVAVSTNAFGIGGNGYVELFDINGLFDTVFPSVPSVAFGSSLTVFNSGTALMVGSNPSFGGPLYLMNRAVINETQFTALDGFAGDGYAGVVAVADDLTLFVIGAPNDDDLGINSGSIYRVQLPLRFCLGKLATHVGTFGNDVIVGTRRKDVITGRGGSDTIRGLGKRDRICGNRGADVIFGGRGRDFISGGRGSDTIRGGRGNDDIQGNRGNDTLIGNGGFDTIDGGLGTDTCVGESVTNCP